MTKDAARHTEGLSWTGVMILAVLWVVLMGTSLTSGQASPEEHA